jgi:hypothetical protein
MNNNNNNFNNGTNNALNLLSQQVLTLSVNTLQQTVGNNQAPVIMCEQIEAVNEEARGNNVTLYIQFNVQFLTSFLKL